MMINEEQQTIPTVDVDGNVEEFVDYTIVPNQTNEFLRLKILMEDSPAYNRLIEITSVETDIIKDSLSLRLGFEVIDEETNQVISEVFEDLSPEEQGVFVRDMGNAFTDIISNGIDKMTKSFADEGDLDVSE